METNFVATIDGTPVDNYQCGILQKYAKDKKIQFIGKPEPVLKAWIKKHIKEHPEDSFWKGIDSTGGDIPSKEVIETTAEIEKKKVVVTKEKSIAEKIVKIVVKQSNSKHKKETAKKKAVIKKVIEKVIAAPKIEKEVKVKRVKREYNPPLNADQIAKLKKKPDVIKIMALDAKKHIKIWKLHVAGYTRKEIAELLTNGYQGHVWNEIERYKESPKRVKLADAVTV